MWEGMGLDDDDEGGRAVLRALWILWQNTLLRNPCSTPLTFFAVFLSLSLSFDIPNASLMPLPIPIFMLMEVDCGCASPTARNEKWSTGSSSDRFMARELDCDPSTPVPEVLWVPVASPWKSKSMTNIHIVECCEALNERRRYVEVKGNIGKHD